MSKPLRSLAILTLLALPGMSGRADSGLVGPNLRFTHLSIGDGMVAGEVRAILQDKEGTVWIGTEEGLCRYDGYEVKTFRNLQTDAESLSGNSVMAMVEDRDGSIWVGTESGFLDRLDPRTGKFTHHRIKLEGIVLPRLDGIRCLMLDRTRSLWIGTGDGVIRLDASRNEATRYHRKDEGQWICNALLEAADGTIWSGTESGEILRLGETGENFQGVADAGGRVSALSGDGDGRLLAAVPGRGLVAFDPRTGADGSPVAGVLLDENPGISTALFVSPGQLWTGGVDGLSQRNQEEGRWHRFRRDPLDSGSLLGSRVSCLFADRRGVLWVGFSSGGVSRFLMESPWFSKLALAESGRPGLSGRSVDCLMRDSRGRIWIGTSDGLDRWDPAVDGIANDLLTTHFGAEAGRHEVTAILEDRSSRIWAGTREGAVHLIDGQSSENGPGLLDKRRVGKVKAAVTALLEDPAGRIWVATRGGGLTVMAPDLAPAAEYAPGGPEGLKDRFINDLCLDASGTIWVGTSSEGLMRYDAASQRFESHPSLNVGEILDLFIDSHGNLWIGSSGRGLTRQNLQTGEILTINRRNSPSHNPLPDDTIRGIEEDKTGFIWLSTDNGLARMDRQTFEFRSFDQHDGLQARMFHSRAAARDELGRLLFGGPNGLTVIDPAALPEPKRAERPILTGLDLFGEPVFPAPGGILERPLALTDSIRVPHARHSRIAFRFSTLDYTTPRRSQFRYRLEGADTEWQMADDSRRATYAGLPPGSYRFVVESSSDGTQWNSDRASVKLEIRPPWHALWYTRAALGAIAVLLSIYLFFHRVRTREESLRRQQEQLQVRYSKAEAELARQLQHAMLLEQTGLALGADDGTEDLLGNALRQFGEAFGVVRSSIRAGTVSPDGRAEGAFRLVAEYVSPAGLGNGGASAAGLIDGERFIQKVLRTDRALAVSDLASRPDLFPGAAGLSQGGTQSVLAVRTSYLGQPNGYIVLQHCGGHREWQADEIKLLESLAGQFGLVLAQLAQQERDEKQRRELELAKQEADLANRSKSDFLAKMTHELRTPLNAIIGFSELLADDTDLTRRQRETLDIINHSGEHLLGVINDILEISKIEAGKVELRDERFSLSSLLSSVYEMLAFGAKSKGLAFAIEQVGDLPGEIVADKGKLRQVLLNLVGNATKFTESGGITVTVRATGFIPGTRRRLVGFEVRDTGPGIAAADLPALFEKFHQTETGLKVRRGTGLGLAISRAFVEMMGGRVEVASTVGVGTIFRFTIQCEEVAPSAGVAGAAAAAAIGGAATDHHPRRLVEGHPEIRILIAEDQPANRLLASRILKAAGFTLCEAEDGAEAVEKWRAFQPHLILMDEEMPVMRGREATRIIREESGDRGPIIVALTAFALDETRLAALASGSDDFLAKPFRIDDLLGTIARHLPVEYQRAPVAQDAA